MKSTTRLLEKLHGSVSDQHQAIYSKNIEVLDAAIDIFGEDHPLLRSLLLQLPAPLIQKAIQKYKNHESNTIFYLLGNSATSSSQADFILSYFTEDDDVENSLVVYYANSKFNTNVVRRLNEIDSNLWSKSRYTEHNASIIILLMLTNLDFSALNQNFVYGRLKELDLDSFDRLPNLYRYIAWVNYVGLITKFELPSSKYVNNNLVIK